MLLCDDEVVTVHFYDGKARGEIERKKERVENALEDFEDYWDIGYEALDGMIDGNFKNVQ